MANHKRHRQSLKRVRCQFCKRTGPRGRSHERDPHPGHPRSPRERVILAEPVPRPGETATALESAYEAWLDKDLELIVDDAGSPADLWERSFIRDAPPVPSFTLMDFL